MSEPLIFDCWCSYGPHPNKDPQERWTLEQLLDDMDFYGIAGALVRHEQAVYYDAMHINERLTRELAGQRDRLWPCWTVMPHQFGDFPEPGDLLRRMAEHDVRALHMQPGRNGYPVCEEVLGPLAAALNPRRTPLLVSIGDLENRYETICRFARIFSECPIVLGEASWAQWRLTLAAMDACPNLHLELHFFQANRALEYLTARYGANRILFGSGLLRHSAGAARGFIDWTLLEEKTVRRFAGGNLTDMLGGGPTPRAPRSGEDELITAARQGRALPLAALDAHCHVLDDGLNGAGVSYVMIQGDAPHMLELTRRMGVRATAMMSWSGTVSMDVQAGNDLIEKIVQKYPEEIIGVSSCDPTHQSAEEIDVLCRRLHGQMGFRGMKPYYTSGLSYADPLYAPYWQYGNEHQLYALLHINPSAGGMEAVGKLAKQYPAMTFLIAHSGGSWPFAREVVQVANQFPNVMAELTLTPVTNGVIEWLCSQIGPDRVLFGTDAPMRDPRPQLGWCVFTRLSLDDKKKILGGNFARILRRGLLSPAYTPKFLSGG